MAGAGWLAHADPRSGLIPRTLCTDTGYWNGELFIAVWAHQPWTGRLVFDHARHRTNMKLPMDYPRINQFPEWYTVEATNR